MRSPWVLGPVKDPALFHETQNSLHTRICGATALRTFLTVTLPTIRNGVLAALLLGVTRASGEVTITMMLGDNVADRTNTLSLEIFNAGGRGDFESATGLCVVHAVTALVLYAAPELVCSKTISP